MFQISEVLKKVPFFRTLGKGGIEFIVERLKFKPFDENELICKIGDPGDKMYIIISGGVKVVVSSEQNKEQTEIARLQGGDYFGEMALLTGEPRSATIITTKPSEMFILNKADFDVIVERYPSITLSMGKIMSQRLRDTLQKAAQPGKAGVAASVKGLLSEKQLVDILKFCESNSLNGKLVITKEDKKGIIQFEKGEMKKVSLGDSSDDEALDQMLNWGEGSFVIEPEPLKMEGAETTEEKEKDEMPQQLLIINNSMVVQKMLQRTFENIGYTVYAVDNKEKGLNLIKNMDFRAIISDIKLPDSNALDITTALREFSSTPLVLLTEEQNRESFAAELVKYKPIAFTRSQELGEILHTVQQITGSNS